VGFVAGYVTAPGSTGSQTVSGLGFTKLQGVLFFGSNSAVEDTIDSSGGGGAFMGLMALDEDDSTVRSEAVTIIPAGGQRAVNGDCVLMLSVALGVEYEAQPVSMGADSFTINWSTVPGATRHIQYLAWGDYPHQAADGVYDTLQTISRDWQVRSMVYVGTISSGGGPGDWNRPDLNGYTFGWWGGGAYKLGDSNGYQGGGLTDIRYPFTGQVATRLFTNGPTATPIIAYGAGFLGPVLTEPTHEAYPVTPPTDYLERTTGGLANYDLMAQWDADSSLGDVTPDGSGGGVVTSGMVNADVVNIAAVIFYTASGYDTGAGFGSPGQGLGFGFWTSGYQGCVIASQDGSLYQSRTKAFASRVRVGSVNAGTCAVSPSQIELTTTVAGTAAHMIYHAFGPSRGRRRPQIYRWFRTFPVP
jgi:hypothetical protein